MPATGSTRTATRWSSSRVRLATSLVASALVAAACVTTTSTAYVPTPGQSRMSLDDARDAIDGLLRAECRRLVQEGKPTQEARVTVDVDAEGDVRQARLTSSTGDATMDRIFGGTAARLHFQKPAPGDLKGPTVPGHMRMGYSCSAQAAVVTIQLL